MLTGQRKLNVLFANNKHDIHGNRGRKSEKDG